MTPPRLHLDVDLDGADAVRLTGPRAHYLVHVLRLRPGAEVRLFNGRQGEFAARVDSVARHEARLRLGPRQRPALPEPGPTLVFAPIRRNRLDWLVEKAVELGAAALIPVLTERTVVKLDHVERLTAIVVEAAEQCGRLTVPRLDPPLPFTTWLAAAAARPLLLLDESGGGRPLLELLPATGDCAILVGPEGGFTPAERRIACSLPGVAAADLGPLILRAETAALAALAAWRLKAASPTHGAP
jgi:16S rRNA (uracil1498-N3)-methyltransferase